MTAQYLHGGDIWKKKDPHAWLDFSANINPLGMPASLKKALGTAYADIGYYPDPYAAGAAESVARYLHTDRENLLLTNGGIDALRIAAEHFASRHCLIPVPCFCEYKRFAHNAGAEIEFVAAIKNDAGYAVDMETIKRIIQPGSLVFLCNPANPTGSVIHPETMLDFLFYSLRAHAFVIIDEAFIDFCPKYSMREYIEGFENAVIAGSLTKFFAVPGLRLGYLYGKKETIAAVKSKTPPWMLNVFAQAAARVLDDTAEFSEKTKLETEKNKLYLQQRLIALGFSVCESHANYLLANGEDTGISAEALNRGLEEHCMMVRDCSNYEGLGKYDFRVAVKSQTDIERLIFAIRSVQP